MKAEWTNKDSLTSGETTKAILVIDVDEEDIGREVNYISVKGGGMTYIVGAKDSQVLIKPLPKKQEHKAGLCSDFILGFEDGWNECLEELEK